MSLMILRYIKLQRMTENADVEVVGHVNKLDHSGILESSRPAVTFSFRRGLGHTLEDSFVTSCSVFAFLTRPSSLYYVVSLRFSGEH